MQIHAMRYFFDLRAKRTRDQKNTAYHAKKLNSQANAHSFAKPTKEDSMKGKWLILVASLATTLSVSGLSAYTDIRSLDANCNGRFDEGEVNECSAYVTGPAKCTYPVTRFQKCNYCTQRCIWEPYTCEKKCCRYVDKYYTKQYCKMVPQYYTQTYCKKCPEYYTVCETKYRKRYVTDEHCYYKPYTTCETTCCDIGDCANPCGVGPAPGAGPAPSYGPAPGAGPVQRQAGRPSAPSQQAPAPAQAPRARTGR